MGLTGWLKRPPSTKIRKNGDSVLLLDLEDEQGSCIRVICLGAVRERSACINKIIINKLFDVISSQR